MISPNDLTNNTSVFDKTSPHSARQWLTRLSARRLSRISIVLLFFSRGSENEISACETEGLTGGKVIIGVVVIVSVSTVGDVTVALDEVDAIDDVCTFEDVVIIGEVVTADAVANIGEDVPKVVVSS